MSEAMERRLQRAAEGIAACRTTGGVPPDRVAKLERLDGAATRPLLEALADPRYPAWPREEDGRHHAWVREHWTPEDAEQWDFLTLAIAEVDGMERTVFAREIADGAELADACAVAHLDPPPEGFTGTPREYYRLAHSADRVAKFDAELQRNLDHYAKYPKQREDPSHKWADEALARAEHILNDPTEEERARRLGDRGLGIRGEGYDWRVLNPSPTFDAELDAELRALAFAGPYHPELFALAAEQRRARQHEDP